MAVVTQEFEIETRGFHDVRDITPVVADFVKKHNGEYIMVDILTCGWSGLQTVRNKNRNQFIHAHRAMHGAFTKNPDHGISMLVLAKVARLIGADQLHVGTAHCGKMGGTALEAELIEEEIEGNFIHPKTKQHILEQKWHNIKPTLAVASGGLHPGHIPALIDRMGCNIVAQFGGGCHGHPNGTNAGAKAIRQAVDAVMHDISLKQYAKKHAELRQALDKWG